VRAALFGAFFPGASGYAGQVSHGLLNRLAREGFVALGAEIHPTQPHQLALTTTAELGIISMPLFGFPLTAVGWHSIFVLAIR
jgi:hypothetical protein